ncbi:hypothetical protein DM785_02440 [Deinococcus actinosclerus]|nr:hypothetical protein DM785_02440 [Deinococcus actinosclerus]
MTRIRLQDRAATAAAQVTSERVTIAAQNVYKALTATFSAEDAQDATYHLLTRYHQGGPFVIATLDGMIFSEREGAAQVLLFPKDWEHASGWRRLNGIADLNDLIMAALTGADEMRAKFPSVFKHQLTTPEAP